MDVQIRYEGFTTAGTSRVYSFVVIDTLGGLHHYTVKVPAESFRSTPLKFQDGPPICLQRLKQELHREKAESEAQAHLNIAEPDIQEYLERHYPRKRS